MFCVTLTGTTLPVCTETDGMEDNALIPDSSVTVSENGVNNPQSVQPLRPNDDTTYSITNPTYPIKITVELTAGEPVELGSLSFEEPNFDTFTVTVLNGDSTPTTFVEKVCQM